MNLTIISIESTGGRWHVVVVARRVKPFLFKILSSQPKLARKPAHSGCPWLSFWRAGKSNVWRPSRNCVASLIPTHAHECSPGDIVGICHLRKAAFPSCPQNHENSPLRFWPSTVSSLQFVSSEHRLLAAAELGVHSAN